MNLSILKTLSVPGFVSDADIIKMLDYDRNLGRIVSDLCIGSDGMANPVMRLGGIDVPAGETGHSGIVLATPEGHPLGHISRTVSTQVGGAFDVSYSFTAYSTALLERGQNRETVESERPGYLVKKVRESIGKMKAGMANKNPSMFASLCGQIAEALGKGSRTDTTMTLTASVIHSVASAILNNQPVDTDIMQTWLAQSSGLVNARAAALKALEDDFLSKKWWFVAHHGEYGFAVYKPTLPPTLKATDLTSSLSRGELSKSDMNLVGWYKSLAHMQQANPDVYNEFYLQWVMSNQVAQTALPQNISPLSWRATPRTTMFGNTHTISGEFDSVKMLPRGDWFCPDAAMTSWTYGSVNPKVGSYFMMECV